MPQTLKRQLRQDAPLISVGVLTADWMHLEDQLSAIQQAGVRLLHFDVMDGCFCPALTFGPPIIKAVRSPLLKDVHLMVEDPLPMLEAYAAAGADLLTVAIEGCRHLHRALQMIGELTNANDPNRSILRGVSLNPGTPLALLDGLLDEIDLVLLLAVNPGYSGQKFIPATGRRLAQVKEMAVAANRDVLVCIDGGVKKDNIAQIAQLGADLIVTGSAVFDGCDPHQNASDMIETLEALK